MKGGLFIVIVLSAQGFVGAFSHRLRPFNREPRECSDGYFTCNDGLCVPNEFLCDGIYDCVGGNDEIDCNVNVSHTRRLRTFNSDSRKCSDGFFMCTDGLCVPNEFVCDGTYDCVGGNDEIDCKVKVSNKLRPFNPNPRECNDGYFTCDNGLCVPNEFVCDGIYNCVGGNDENDCNVKASHRVRLSHDEPRKCSDGYFQCSNGLCVPDAVVCDGVYDCVGGADEVDCGTAEKSLEEKVDKKE